MNSWWQRLDPRHNVWVLAAMVFGGAALGCTFLLGEIAGAIFRTKLERQTGQMLETLACQVSDKLDRTVYERYREIQFATGLGPLRLPEATPAERRRMFEAMQKAEADYAWIGLADPTGTVIVATQGLLEGTKVDIREWFRSARSGPFASDVHEYAPLAKELPNPTGEKQRYIDLAAPVTAANGQSLGVLGAHLDWSLAREAQLSVVPEKARRESLSVALYAKKGEMVLDSGGSGWTEAPGIPTLPARAGLRGSFTENAEGGTVYLTGYARSQGYRDYPGLHLLVVVRQPTAIVFAPVRELRGWIWRLGGLMAGGFVILSWVVVMRLNRPMRAIARAADRIRAGDILSLIPRYHDGDAGRLSTALGDMVDAFRAKEEQLEADNAQLEARMRAGSSAPAARPDEPPQRPKPRESGSDNIRW
jgi:HAMP domain-containing protein